MPYTKKCLGKKRFLLFVIMTIIAVTNSSCSKKEKAYDRPELMEIRSICELATVECYYNNVAKSVKTSGSGIAHWGEKDRTFWIEYSGIAEIGIDMSEVAMKVKGDQITITLPEAKLLRFKADEKTLNEDSYVASEDAFFNKNKITAKDQQSAIKDAQDKMEAKVRENKAVLLSARERAKKLIENYIMKLGEAADTEYQITWKYLEGN